MLRKFTGLRLKVLSIISITFIILFLGQLLIARFTLFEGHLNLLKRRAYVNAERLEKVLANEITQLDRSATDWAEWDDTYQFVRDGNAVYVSSNLIADTFTELYLNLLLIINNTGKIVYGQGFDLQTQQPKPVPTELTTLISQVPSPILRRSRSHRSLAGILLIDKEPMLISTRAILPTLEEGTIRGTFMMGRLLNKKQFEKLSQTLQLKLTSYRYNDPHLPTDIRSVLSQLSAKNAIAVQTFADNTIASYLLLRDILGKPALVIRIDMDSSIYTQTRKAYTYYFWTTLAIGLIFCLLFLLLLNQLILSPISYLTKRVTQIGSTGNLSVRVTLDGRDELSTLANRLNQMLEQLQQSQQAYQESEERYFLAVAGANDGIWDWNLHKGQIYFSPRWKGILGYEDKEIPNEVNEWFQRVHPQEIEILKWGLEMNLNGQTPHFQYEYQMLHKDGTYRWVSCRGLAVRDEVGVAYRIAGSMSDISKRKQAENALAEQTIELSRSNAELEQFAYVASHDLQEPLRKIEAFSDRLQTKYSSDLDEKGRDYLERMRKAASRMRTLIEDLLALSRITTQAQSFTPVNLNDIVQEVISDLEMRIRETQGRVEVENLPTVNAEPLQMRQLFLNLIGNALKFHRQNLPPLVKVQGTILSDGWCQITIADNGIGFEEKYRDRIFQLFQRLHGRGEYEGTGIGLAICTKIVTRHSGSISVQSSPGVGSTFAIALPLQGSGERPGDAGTRGWGERE